jgi:hypothetical protein
MRWEYLGIVYRMVLFYDYRGPMWIVIIIIIIIPSRKNDINIIGETVIAKCIYKNNKRSKVMILYKYIFLKVC